MDVETYSLSRKYLARYHLLSDMRKLLGRHKLNGRSRIPLAELTPDWYISEYLRMETTLEDLQHRRIIHDPDGDTDIEPNADGDLKKGRKRRLRYISAAEIRSLFAMHARWLIKDQGQILHKKSRLINVNAWADWLKICRKWRERAYEEDPDLPFGVFDEDEETSAGESDYGMEEEEAEVLAQIAEVTEEKADLKSTQLPSRKRKRRNSVSGLPDLC